MNDSTQRPAQETPAPSAPGGGQGSTELAIKAADTYRELCDVLQDQLTKKTYENVLLRKEADEAALLAAERLASLEKMRAQMRSIHMTAFNACGIGAAQGGSKSAGAAARES